MTTILEDVKKYLGIDPEMSDFDTELLAEITTNISTLTDFGIGSPDLMVDAATDWPELIGTTNRFVAAKTYIYLKVKAIFDPPTSSFHLDAIEKQAAELEWRLNHRAEGVTTA